jgi:hypothetical protein
LPPCVRIYYCDRASIVRKVGALYKLICRASCAATLFATANEVEARGVHRAEDATSRRLRERFPPWAGKLQ